MLQTKSYKLKLLILILAVFLAPEKGISQVATVGLSLGPETGIGLPKMGGYYKYLDQEMTMYVGGEASLWFLFTFWYSVNLYHGIEYKSVSLETSFSYWNFIELDFDDPADQLGPFKHLTFTPKLGLKLWDVLQFKVGPSLFLWKDYHESSEGYAVLNFTRKGRVHMNYELIFHITLKT